MLFVLTYTARDVTEKKEKRSLSLFTNWQPPAGYEFKSHYALADGTGGVASTPDGSSACAHPIAHERTIARPIDEAPAGSIVRGRPESMFPSSCALVAAIFTDGATKRAGAHSSLVHERGATRAEACPLRARSVPVHRQRKRAPSRKRRRDDGAVC